MLRWIAVALAVAALMIGSRLLFHDDLTGADVAYSAFLGACVGGASAYAARRRDGRSRLDWAMLVVGFALMAGSLIVFAATA